MIAQISNIDKLMTPNIVSQAKKRKERLSSMEQEHWRQAISWFFMTDLIKTRIRAEIQMKMRGNDLGTLILAIVLILTQFIQQALYLTFNKVIDKDSGIVTIYIIGKSSLLIEILRGISSIGCICLTVLIIFHYLLHKNLLIFKHQYEVNSSLLATKLLIPLLLELLFSLIHSPPFLNDILLSIPTFEDNPSYIDIDINIPISVLSECKFYLIVKFLFNYSQWGNDRAAGICREANVAHGKLFVLKAKLRDHPFLLISLISILSSAFLGYCLSAVEMCFIYNVPLRFFNDWTNPFNGIWCISTSMITLGYGDVSPRTIVGRMLIALAPIWGLTILSYFFLSMISMSQMDAQEAKAYKEMTNDRVKKQVKGKGLSVILSYYRLSRILSFDSDDQKDLEKARSEKRRKGALILDKALKEFRKIKRQFERLRNEVTTEDLLNKINRQIKETMTIQVYTSKTELSHLVQRIDLSTQFQSIIKQQVKLLLFLNTAILKAIEAKEAANKVN